MAEKDLISKDNLEDPDEPMDATEEEGPMDDDDDNFIRRATSSGNWLKELDGSPDQAEDDRRAAKTLFRMFCKMQVSSDPSPKVTGTLAVESAKKSDSDSEGGPGPCKRPKLDTKEVNSGAEGSIEDHPDEEDL